jgi:hypothetical protein
VTALERWVEEGKAPNELIATKMAPNSNQTLWRRPVCTYPKVARYKSSGDPHRRIKFHLHRAVRAAVAADHSLHGGADNDRLGIRL